MELKERKDIEEKYKWNLTDYYKNDEEYEKDLKSFLDSYKKIEEYNGKLKDKKTILECFKFTDKLDEKLERLYVYASISRDEDVAVEKNQQRYGKISNIANDYDMACSFLTPQLSSLDDKFLSDLIKDEDFKDYDRTLNNILKNKPHILSEKEERLLSSVSNFAGDFKLNFSNFENGDLEFNDVEDGKGNKLPMNQSVAGIYLTDEDRVLRKNAFKELNGAFGRYNNFLTSNYIASVKKDIFYAKTRNFGSAIEKALFYEDVDKEVYYTLLKSVNKFLNLEYRFFKLKEKMLGVDKIAVCDMRINPLKEVDTKYTFEEGFDLVCKALSPLGREYVEKLQNLKDNRKIDVMPNKGKCSGAYMTSAYGCSPVVLTNFMGKFNDVSTIAHELGHAMHSYNSDKTQPISKAGYTIFLAEIASTVNECLLNRYMLENARTKEEKIYYLNEFLSTFHATVFRQTMFAEFEEKIHAMCENNEGVSTTVVNEVYLDLIKKYFGKDVEIFDEIKYEWSRIPHFFTAFYVYKYATGLISAIAICNKILSKEKDAVENYYKFLSLGGSTDPLSILSVAGVDLKQEKTFEDSFKYIENYLDELESLL